MADEQDLNIRIRVTGDTAAAKQAEGALQGVKDAAGKTGEAATKAAKETKSLGTEVKEMSRIGHEAEGVLHGLERGGLGGLAQAGINAGKIIRALATGAIGAVLVPAVVGVTALIKILTHVSEENAKAMKKMWDDHAASSQRYADKLEEVKKTSEKNLKEMVKQVEALAKSYADVEKAIDSAASRIAKLAGAKKDLETATIDTEEKKALAAVTTPEAKERVTKQFALRREKISAKESVSGFENTELDAKVRIDAAQKHIQDVRQKQDEAEAKVREAEADFEKKRQAARNVGTLPGKAAEDTRKDALAAGEALKQAKLNAKEVGQKTGEEVTRATDAIQAAKLTIEETSLRRQAYTKIVEGKLVDEGQAKKESAKAAQEAQAKGGFKGQEKAIGDIKAISDTGNILKEAVKENVALGGTVNRPAAAGAAVKQDSDNIGAHLTTTTGNLKATATHFKTMAEVTGEIAKQSKKSVDLVKSQARNSRESGSGQ